MPSAQTKALRVASAQLPGVLRAGMLRPLESGEFAIGAGAYETELAMCAVAAAAALADSHDAVPSEWDRAWGTEADFGTRVVDFVLAFD